MLVKNRLAPRHWRSRPGLSLTEVLIAVFCMAIGMISLLALFPIGMLNMAATIRNNRMAVAADNARAVFEAGIRNDPAFEPNVLVNGQQHAPWNPSWIWTDRSATGDTSPLWDAANNTWRFPQNGPSPPILVDPLGWSLSFPPPPHWTTGYQGAVPGPILTTRISVTGANTSVGIRRSGVTMATSPSAATTRQMTLGWFTQGDDVTYGQTGMPDAFGTTIERERRYSVAYLWRRTNFSDRNSVEVTEILFSGRKLSGAGGTTPIPEQSVLGDPTAPPSPWAGRVFVQGSRLARVKMTDVNNGPLALKPGYWVMDTTVIPGTAAVGFTDAIMNGFFYQIVGVSDPDVTAAGTFATIELDRPAQADGYVGTFLYGVGAVVRRGK